MNKILLTTALFCICAISSFAQNFVSSYDTFSSDKISYFTMADGSKVEGKIDKLKRTKGLIEQIILKKEGSKEKITLNGEQIQSMYLYPSGFSKYSAGVQKLSNVNRWEQDGGVDDKLINEGYAYFESSNVILKKGTKKLLLQLLNPSFCSKIKVFHNPMAAETSGIGVGGLQVTGGDDKSHYIKLGNADAFLLAKKNYRDKFLEIFKDCTTFTSKYPKPSWTDFDKHTFEYTKDCSK